jgi:hypothetical protein
MTPLILINSLFISFSSKGAFKDIPQPIPNTTHDDHHNDSFPDWIRNLYEINTDEFLNNAIPEVIFFKKLSDSISYCLYQVDDGICQVTFVATQKNKKKYKHFKIGNQCDEDYAHPIYSTTTYEHDTTNSSIKLSIETEKANIKYLIKTRNGFQFKNGYDMENTKTIQSSISKTIIIDKLGKIEVKDKNGRYH